MFNSITSDVFLLVLLIHSQQTDWTLFVNATMDFKLISTLKLDSNVSAMPHWQPQVSLLLPHAALPWPLITMVLVSAIILMLKLEIINTHLLFVFLPILVLQLLIQLMEVANVFVMKVWLKIQLMVIVHAILLIPDIQ